MFVLINKERDISSFKAIKKYAREHNIKKIGHTGTLDPMAEGLLLVATDASTKLISYIKHTNKTYQVEAELGYETNSFDTEGELVNKYPVDVTIEEIKEGLKTFSGKQLQTPPIFSAKKVKGRRAYELARKNEEVKLDPVEVNVINIHFEGYKNKTIKFTTTVSKGTYIRSMVQDLGKKLGCGAVMSKLVRTKIGELDFSYLNKPLPLDLLFDLPTIEISQQNISDLNFGRNLKLDHNQKNNQKVLLVNNQKEVQAIACIIGKDEIKPVKVLAKPV